MPAPRNPRPTRDLAAWLAHHARSDRVWYVKRLTGNDTLANGSHQAGPYLPREFLRSQFPSLRREDENPFVWFDMAIDSHHASRKVKSIWYNNKFRGGTRNETRLTNFGGSSSPLLDPESTGALTVFAFGLNRGKDCDQCGVWVCESEEHEDLVEDWVGPVDPSHPFVWSPDSGRQDDPKFQIDCWLAQHELPTAWLKEYPTGAEVVRKTVEMWQPARQEDPDTRLLNRRACEYQVFRSLEEAVELPSLQGGFDSIDPFVARAKTILQRRKARSGRSLELHVRQILLEEGMQEERDFVHGPVSESGKRPDFLFPNQARYRDPGFPADGLRMLAVKTTCKDRWRQVLTEADRIRVKHLLTLQEGVSLKQHQEMVESGVQLVVPEHHKRKFHKDIRPSLQSVADFVRETRELGA